MAYDLTNNVSSDPIGDIGVAEGIQVCGVNPHEIYGSSGFSSIFNNKITPENFITIVIQQGSESTRVDSNTVITLLSKDDTFSMYNSANYNSPLGSSSNAIGVGSIGGTYESIGKAVNPGLQLTSGISLFNKIAYLPVWSGNSCLSLNLKCFLYATSDPLIQVQTPLDILTRFVSPMSTGNSFSVSGPGPTLNPGALQEFLNDMNKSYGVNGSSQGGVGNYNLSSLFMGSDLVSVQIGGLALISPVVIEEVLFTIPNLNNNVKLSSLSGKSSLNTSAYPYADVSIKIKTYFPLIYNGPNDYDSVKLFPKSGYANGESKIDKIKNFF